MALWGNNDNLGNAGTVTLDYTTLTVTGTGTTFGVTGGGHTEAQVGDVIHFGHRDATDGGISTYFGSAVIVGVASTSQLTIGSTASLNNSFTAIAATTYTISQCPISFTQDPAYSERNTNSDTFVYGISTTGSQSAADTAFETGVGWVGITTYNDQHGNLRVKKEILVAMSGITTGNAPVYGNPPV